MDKHSYTNPELFTQTSEKICSDSTIILSDNEFMFVGGMKKVRTLSYQLLLICYTCLIPS